MKQKKRSEINVEDTWDLSIIYQNDDEFYKEYEILKNNIKKFSSFEGKLLESGKTLLEFLEFSDE